MWNVLFAFHCWMKSAAVAHEIWMVKYQWHTVHEVSMVLMQCKRLKTRTNNSQVRQNWFTIFFNVIESFKLTQKCSALGVNQYILQLQFARPYIFLEQYMFYPSANSNIYTRIHFIRIFFRALIYRVWDSQRNSSLHVHTFHIRAKKIKIYLWVENLF